MKKWIKEREKLKDEIVKILEDGEFHEESELYNLLNKESKIFRSKELFQAALQSLTSKGKIARRKEANEYILANSQKYREYKKQREKEQKTQAEEFRQKIDAVHAKVQEILEQQIFISKNELEAKLGESWSLFNVDNSPEIDIYNAYRRQEPDYTFYYLKNNEKEAKKKALEHIRPVEMARRARLDNKCVECGKKTTNSSVYNLLGVRVCLKCQKKYDKYRLIYKTTALKEFEITEDELYKLKYLEIPNPHYRSAAPSHLFLRSQVEKLAEGLQKEIDKEFGKTEDEKKREKELFEALIKNRISFDPDEPIFSDYLDGKSDLTVLEIISKKLSDV